MKRINPFLFYELGTFLSPLEQIDGTSKAAALFASLLNANMAIRDFVSGDVISLGVAKSSASILQETLKTTIDKYFFHITENGTREFRFPDDTITISSWEIETIKGQIITFKTIFNEEMREAATYFVPQRGIYHTPSLIDEAERSFPKHIIDVLPEKTKVDWRAAGRCLAFNLLSASGFHVARAVEGMLETYYQKYSGKPPTLKGWHDYITALRGIEGESKPEEKTLAELDQMRSDYRNPIMHPRVVLDEADARMLFANGESLIICMAQELAKRP